MAALDQDAIFKRVLEKNPFSSEKRLADRLDMTPNTWTAYKQGRQPLKLSHITKICDTLGVDAHWLLFGQHSPQLVGELIDNGWINTEMLNLPVFDVALSAGAGIIAIDQMPAGEISLHRQLLYRIGAQPDACYVVQARGDSMWPTIPDGSFLIVDGSKTEIQDGLIYHFNVSERVLVKRSRWRMDGRLYLTSDNAAAGYPDESFDNDKIHELSVGGQIMYVMHEPLPVVR